MVRLNKIVIFIAVLLSYWIALAAGVGQEEIGFAEFLFVWFFLLTSSIGVYSLIELARGRKIDG